MTEGFNIDNGGKKERLNKFRHGIHKEQMSEKHKKLFNVFDENQDGHLNPDEISNIEHILSISAGEDKTLNEQENNVTNSVFAKNFDADNSDFMGFVKSLSDASANMPEDGTQTPTADIDLSKIQNKWDPVYKALREAIEADETARLREIEQSQLAPRYSATTYTENSYIKYKDNQIDMKVELSPDGRINLYSFYKYVIDGEEYTAINKFNGEDITIILVKNIKNDGTYDKNDLVSTTTYGLNGKLKARGYTKDGKLDILKLYDETGKLESVSKYVYDEVNGNPKTGLSEIRTRYTNGKGTISSFIGDKQYKTDIKSMKSDFTYEESDITGKEEIDIEKELQQKIDLGSVLWYMADVNRQLQQGNTLDYDTSSIRSIIDEIKSGSGNYEKIQDNPPTYRKKVEVNGKVQYEGPDIYIRPKHKLNEFGVLIEEDGNYEYVFRYANKGAPSSSYYHFDAEGNFLYQTVKRKEEPQVEYYRYPNGDVEILKFNSKSKYTESLSRFEYRENGEYTVKETVSYEYDGDKLISYTKSYPNGENVTTKTDSNIIHWHASDDEGAAEDKITAVIDKQYIVTSIPIMNKNNEIIGYKPISQIETGSAGEVRQGQYTGLLEEPAALTDGNHYDMFMVENEIRASFLNSAITTYGTIIDYIKGMKDNKSILDASWWTDKTGQILSSKIALFQGISRIFGIGESNDVNKVLESLRQMVNSGTIDGMISKWEKVLAKAEEMQKVLVYEDIYKKDKNNNLILDTDKINKIKKSKKYAETCAEFSKFYKDITGFEYSSKIDDISYYDQKKKYLNFNLKIKEMSLDLGSLSELYETNPSEAKVIADNILGKYNVNKSLSIESVKATFFNELKANNNDISETTLFKEYYAKQSMDTLKNTKVSVERTAQEGSIAMRDYFDTAVDLVSVIAEFGLLAKGTNRIVKGIKGWVKANTAAGKAASTFLKSGNRIAKTLNYTAKATEQGLNLGTTMGIYDAAHTLGNQVVTGKYDGLDVLRSGVKGAAVGAAAGFGLGIVAPHIVRMCAPEFEDTTKVVEEALEEAAKKAEGSTSTVVKASKAGASAVTEVEGKYLADALAKASAGAVSHHIPTQAVTFLAEVSSFTAASIGADLVDTGDMRKMLKATKKYQNEQIEKMSRTELMAEILKINNIDTYGKSEAEIVAAYVEFNLKQQFVGLGKLKIAGFIVANRVHSKAKLETEYGKYTNRINIKIENGKYYDAKGNELSTANIAAKVQLNMALDILDEQLRNKFNKNHNKELDGKDFYKLIYGVKADDVDENTKKLMEKFKIKADKDGYKITTRDTKEGEEIKTDDLEKVLETFLKECHYDPAAEEARAKAQSEWEQEQTFGKQANAPTREEVENAKKILGMENEPLTEEAVKKAYRKFAIKYHPDKNQDNPEAQTLFTKYTEAKNVLDRYFESQKPAQPTKPEDVKPTATPTSPRESATVEENGAPLEGEPEASEAPETPVIDSNKPRATYIKPEIVIGGLEALCASDIHKEPEHRESNVNAPQTIATPQHSDAIQAPMYSHDELMTKFEPYRQLILDDENLGEEFYNILYDKYIENSDIYDILFNAKDFDGNPLPEKCVLGLFFDIMGNSHVTELAIKNIVILLSLYEHQNTQYSPEFGISETDFRLLKALENSRHDVQGDWRYDSGIPAGFDGIFSTLLDIDNNEAKKKFLIKALENYYTYYFDAKEKLNYNYKNIKSDTDAEKLFNLADRLAAKLDGNNRAALWIADKCTTPELEKIAFRLTDFPEDLNNETIANILEIARLDGGMERVNNILDNPTDENCKEIRYISKLGDKKEYYIEKLDKSGILKDERFTSEFIEQNVYDSYLDRIIERDMLNVLKDKSAEEIKKMASCDNKTYYAIIEYNLLDDFTINDASTVGYNIDSILEHDLLQYRKIMSGETMVSLCNLNDDPNGYKEYVNDPNKLKFAPLGIYYMKRFSRYSRPKSTEDLSDYQIQVRDFYDLADIMCSDVTEGKLSKYDCYNIYTEIQKENAHDILELYKNRDKFHLTPKDFECFVRNINDYNTDLAKDLITDTTFPKKYLHQILTYAKDKNSTATAKNIISNLKLRDWMFKNLDNGLEMDSIVNLARTQKKLFNEVQSAKKEKQIPKQVQNDNSVEEAQGAQVQEAESEEVQQVIDSLVELGINANMAEKAYVKLCMDKQGFVDKIRLEAVLALVKTFGIERWVNDKGNLRVNPYIKPKDITEIFNLAVGSPLSNANGQFRPDVIKDIIILRQAGITDVRLATNLAAIKNMNLIEMKDRFNTKVRNEIAERVKELPEGIKTSAKTNGVDIDAIVEKAMTEPKGGKVQKVEVETVKLRQLDDIYGAERILITKHKQEIEQYAKEKGLNGSQDVWGNEEAFKRWAEERLTDLLDFEKHPEYLAEGEYATINNARKEGITNWYKYLTTESDYKDNPFVHLMVLESMIKDFKPDSASVPPAVSHEAFNAAHDALLQEGNGGNVSFEKVYAEQTRAKAIEQFSHGTQVVDGIEGQWVTIPRSQKGEPDYDEHIAMVQALSEGSSWCLRFNNAHGYLQGGNLHFFVDKYGRSQVAINETDGKITQIQKRYNQNSTVPVPYVIVIDKFMKANNYDGIDSQMKKALDAKPEFDRLRAEVTKLMEGKNYLEVFDILASNYNSKRNSCKATLNDDGTYTLNGYKSQLTDQYSVSDLGIDENELLSNVSRVRFGLQLNGSNVTEMKKLRKVGGNINFGDNKVSDLSSLEELAGHPVTWIKPEPPKPDKPDDVDMPAKSQSSTLQSTETPVIDSNKPRATYIKPEIVIGGLEALCASDIKDNEIPVQYRSLWKSCKTKAKYILESLNGGTKELRVNSNTKLIELMDDIEILAKNAKGKVQQKLSKLYTSFKDMFSVEKSGSDVIDTPIVRNIKKDIKNLTYDEIVKDFVEQIQNSANISDLIDHLNVFKKFAPNDFRFDSDGAVSFYDITNEVSYHIEFDGQGNIIKYSSRKFLSSDKKFYTYDKNGNAVEVKQDEYYKVRPKIYTNEVRNFVITNPDLLPEETRKLLLQNENHYYTVEDIKELSSMMKTQEDIDIVNKLLNTRGSESMYIRAIGNMLKLSQQRFGVRDIIKVLKSDEARKYVLEQIENDKYAKKTELEPKLNEGDTFESFVEHDINSEVDLSYRTKVITLDVIYTDLPAEYAENAAIREQINAQVPDGEAACINGQMYCRADGKLIPINLTKETFDRLFPVEERYNIKQGRIGDCYFIAELGAYMASPNGRATLYSAFRQEGNDIILKFPVFDNFEIKFENGKLNKLYPISLYKHHGKWKIGLGSAHVEACDGIQMVEQAYSFIRNNYDDAEIQIVANDKFLMNKQMQELEGSRMGSPAGEVPWLLGNTEDVINYNKSCYTLGARNAKTVEEGLETLAGEAENNPNVFGSLSFGDDVAIDNGIELSAGHQYRIIGYDKDNQKVLLVNPHDSSKYFEVPLDIFKTASPKFRVFRIVNEDFVPPKSVDEMPVENSTVTYNAQVDQKPTVTEPIAQTQQDNTATIHDKPQIKPENNPEQETKPELKPEQPAKPENGHKSKQVQNDNTNSRVESPDVSQTQNSQVNTTPSEAKVNTPKVYEKATIVKNTLATETEVKTLLHKIGFTDEEITKYVTPATIRQLQRIIKPIEFIYNNLMSAEIKKVLNKKLKLEILDEITDSRNSAQLDMLEKSFQYINEDNVKYFDAEFKKQYQMSEDEYLKAIIALISSDKLPQLIEIMPMIADMYGKVGILDAAEVLKGDNLDFVTQENLNYLRKLNSKLPEDFQFGISDCKYLQTDKGINTDLIDEYVNTVNEFKLLCKGANIQLPMTKDFATLTSQLKTVIKMIETYGLDFTCGANTPIKLSDLVELAKNPHLSQIAEMLKTAKPEIKRQLVHDIASGDLTVFNKLVTQAYNIQYDVGNVSGVSYEIKNNIDVYEKQLMTLSHMNFAKMVNGSVPDSRFQLKTGILAYIDSSELTEQSAKRYIKAVENFKNLVDDDVLKNISFYAGALLVNGSIKGYIETIEKLNGLLEQGLQLKLEARKSVDFTNLLTLCSKAEPNNILKFVNKLAPKYRHIGIEYAAEGKVSIDEKGAELINYMFSRYEDYKAGHIIADFTPKKDGTIDTDGLIELDKLVHPNGGNIGFDYDNLKVANGDYKTAAELYKLTHDIEPQIYKNAIKLKNTPLEECIAAFKYGQTNGFIDCSNFKELFEIEHPMNAIKKIEYSAFPDVDIDTLMYRYLRPIKYKGRNRCEDSTLEDYRKNINIVKNDENMYWHWHHKDEPKLSDIFACAQSDIKPDEFAIIYKEMKKCFPVFDDYSDIMGHIANFNKDFIFEILGVNPLKHQRPANFDPKAGLKLTDEQKALIENLAPENIDVVKELYGAGADIKLLARNIASIGKEVAKRIKTMLADKDIDRNIIAGCIPAFIYSDEKIPTITTFAKNENIPLDVRVAVSQYITSENMDIAINLIDDPNVPNELIPKIIKYTTVENIEYVKKMCTERTLPDEEIVRRAKGGYLSDRHVQEHAELQEDAIERRDLLKSGMDDLTDYDIKRTMDSSETKKALYFIGKGNLEAAFPMTIEGFEDVCEDIADMNISAKNKEFLLQKVNPYESQKYNEYMNIITPLKQKLREIIGEEKAKQIDEIQSQRDEVEAQIKAKTEQLRGTENYVELSNSIKQMQTQLKQTKDETKKPKIAEELNQKTAECNAVLNRHPEITTLQNEIRDLIKQSKILNGKAQALYFSCENVEEVRKLMGEINAKTKELNAFLKEFVDINPQQIIDKVRVLAAIDDITSEEEMKNFINMIQPSSVESDKAWDEAVNRKIYEKIGIACDENLAKKLDLIHCKYLSKMMASSYDFFNYLKLLVQTVKDNPDKSIEEILDSMPQNVKTKEMLEEIGVDYEKLTKVDKNSYVAVRVKLDAEAARKKAIDSLEEDLNDELFKKLPENIHKEIIDELEKIGVTFEKQYKDNFVGDGMNAGQTVFYRLYKNGKPIEFSDLKNILSTIKKTINKNEFWTKTQQNQDVESAKGTLYNHLTKLRAEDLAQAQSINNDEEVEVEIHKTDMYDVKKALGLGEDASCCTAFTGCNSFSAATYVMNKCIGAFELVDKNNYVGNTMIYLAYVDGEPALVLDNIELKVKYRNNNAIRDAFLEYAKKFCAEIGRPDIPIYAGPHRHKLEMSIYPKTQHKMRIIGNTGNQKVYIDCVTCGKVLDGTENLTIDMYELYKPEPPKPVKPDTPTNPTSPNPTGSEPTPTDNTTHRIWGAIGNQPAKPQTTPSTSQQIRPSDARKLDWQVFKEEQNTLLGLIIRHLETDSNFVAYRDYFSEALNDIQIVSRWIKRGKITVEDFTPDEIKRLQDFVKKYDQYNPEPSSDIFDLLNEYEQAVECQVGEHDRIVRGMSNPIFDIRTRFDLDIDDYDHAKLIENLENASPENVLFAAHVLRNTHLNTKEEALKRLTFDYSKLDLTPYKEFLESNGFKADEHIAELVFSTPEELEIKKQRITDRNNELPTGTSNDDLKKWKVIVNMTDEEYQDYVATKDNLPQYFQISDFSKLRELKNSPDGDYAKELLELKVPEFNPFFENGRRDDTRFTFEQVEKLVELSHQDKVFLNELINTMSVAQKHKYGADVPRFGYLDIVKLMELSKTNKADIQEILKLDRDFGVDHIKGLIKLKAIDSELYTLALSDSYKSYLEVSCCAMSLANAASKDLAFTKLLVENGGLHGLEIEEAVDFCNKYPELGNVIQKRMEEMSLTAYELNRLVSKANSMPAMSDDTVDFLKSALEMKKNDGNYRFMSDFSILLECYITDSNITKELINWKATQKGQWVSITFMQVIDIENPIDFNPYEIQQMIPLFQKDRPTITEVINKYSEDRGKDQFAQIYELYASEDRDLAIRLLDEKDIVGKTPRFVPAQVKNIIPGMKEKPKQVQEMLDAKAILDDGTLIYAYSPEQIVQYYDYPLSHIRELMELTTTSKDGNKVKLLSGWNIERLEQFWLKSPETTQFLNKVLHNPKYQALFTVLNQENVETFKDQKILNLLDKNGIDKAQRIELIPQDKLGNAGIILNMDNSSKVITYNTNENGHVEVIGVETSRPKVSRPDTNHIKHEYSDGSYLVEEIGHITDYLKNEIDAKPLAVTMKKTWYDSDGVQTRSEVLTPVEGKSGEYTINVYERGLNQAMKKSTAGTVKLYGSENQGMRVERTLTSPNGTVTKQTRIEGPNGQASTYEIRKADGTLIYNQTRQHNQINENLSRTQIGEIGADGKVVVTDTFDVIFEGDEVKVIHTGADGNVDLITFDSTVLDPKLKELFKKIPGDYFFRMKQAGLTRFELVDHDIENNACYNEHNKTIQMSLETMNDPFVAIHELSHMIDITILDNYHNSDEYQEVYHRELDAYKKVSGNQEEEKIVGYFSSTYHGYGKGEAESAAEIAANESGTSHDDEYKALGMRSVVLEQNTPETTALYLNKIKSIGYDPTPKNPPQKSNPGYTMLQGNDRVLGITPEISQTLPTDSRAPVNVPENTQPLPTDGRGNHILPFPAGLTDNSDLQVDSNKDVPAIRQNNSADKTEQDFADIADENQEEISPEEIDKMYEETISSIADDNAKRLLTRTLGRLIGVSAPSVVINSQKKVVIDNANSYKKLMTYIANISDSGQKARIEAEVNRRISDVLNSDGSVIIGVFLHELRESIEFTPSERFIEFIRKNRPEIYAEIMKAPEEINNPKYLELKRNYEILRNIDPIVDICETSPHTPEAELAYEKYLNALSIDDKIASEQVRKLCRQINKDFGVKVFLPANLKEAGGALILIYMELANYKMLAKEYNETANIPPVLNLLGVDKQYYDNTNTEYGGTAAFYNDNNNTVNINGLTISIIKRLLRHELLHANIPDISGEFPEWFQPESYVGDLLDAGIPSYDVVYAMENLQEFLAVVSEGDMNKYNNHFKNILRKLGMPEFVLHMDNIEASRVPVKIGVARLIQELGINEKIKEIRKAQFQDIFGEDELPEDDELIDDDFLDDELFDDELLEEDDDDSIDSILNKIQNNPGILPIIVAPEDDAVRNITDGHTELSESEIEIKLVQKFGSYQFNDKQLKLLIPMYEDYPEIVKSVLKSDNSGLTNENIIDKIGRKVSEYINNNLPKKAVSTYTPKVEIEMPVARTRYDSGDKTLDVTLPPEVSEAVAIPEKIKAELGTTSIHLAEEYDKNLSGCVDQVTKIFGIGTDKDISTKIQSVKTVSTRAKGPASIEPKLEKALRKNGHLDYDSAKAAIGDAVGARIITSNLSKLTNQEISERIENMLIDNKPLTSRQKELLKNYIYEEEFSLPKEKLEAYYLFERFTRPLVEARTAEVVNELILSVVKNRMIKENLTIEQVAEQGIVTDKVLLERLATDNTIVPLEVLQINNYCGLWGIPEFTVEQSQALSMAMGEGKSIYTRADLEQFLYSNTEFTSPSEVLSDENSKLPKAIKASGYRTTQMYVVFQNGTLGEIQFRGTETNNIGEYEHIAYDLRQGKNTLGPIFDEFKANIEKLTDDDYIEYNIYLEACYNYYNRIELGLPTTKPKLPENFPKVLSEENMKLLHDNNKVRLNKLEVDFKPHFTRD